MEVTSFVSHLAVDRKVSAPTQSQALSALLFMYQHVLEIKPDWLDDVVRAKRPRRLPVVLTQDETRRLLGKAVPLVRYQRQPCNQAGRAHCKHQQTYRSPYLTALLCDPPYRERLRHSQRTGVTGSKRCINDNDTHPPTEQGCARCSQPAGAGAGEAYCSLEHRRTQLVHRRQHFRIVC
jgi:hypothetical protein